MKVYVTAYRAWLAEVYRPNTVTTLVRDLQTLIRHGGPPSDKRLKAYRRTLRLYNAFAEIKKASRVEVTFPPLPPPDPRRIRKKAQGKKRVLPFDTKDWWALRHAFQEDPRPAARVLYWMSATGFRVGDALRVTRAQIERGLKREDRLTEIELKGGKSWHVDLSGTPEAWEGLRGLMRRGQNVAQALAGSGASDAPGGAAYQQVRRCFQSITQELGLGKPHLHKIRHTWAHLIAQLDPDASRQITKALGHSQPQTAEVYTQGAFAQLVAKLQRRLEEQ